MQIIINGNFRLDLIAHNIAAKGNHENTEANGIVECITTLYTTGAKPNINKIYAFFTSSLVLLMLNAASCSFVGLVNLNAAKNAIMFIIANTQVDVVNS